MKDFLLVLSLLSATNLSLSSCRKDAGVDGGGTEVTDRFRTDIEEMEGIAATKTILTASDIETKQSSVTLAAYSGGKLSASGYYTAEFTSMPLGLIKGWAYHVYALVNMGDMRSSLPTDESALPALTYTISAYTGAGGIDTVGIPMAGSLPEFVAGTGAGRPIPVKRLLAKVTVNVHCTWPGPLVNSVEVRNMNKTLRPFGASAITSRSDRLATVVESASSPSPGATLSAVLYVPENMQGTVSDISGSFYKSKDHDSTVAGKADFLTYIETAVDACSPRYNGEVRYRSYLGNNATTNFDIERNAAYVWELTYTEDGLQYNDWKHGTENLSREPPVVLESIHCHYDFTWNWNVNDENELYANKITEQVRFIGNYSDGTSKPLPFQVAVPANGLIEIMSWNDALALTTEGETRVYLDNGGVPTAYLPEQRLYKAFADTTVIRFKDGMTEGDDGYFTREWNQVTFILSGNNIVLDDDRLALYGDNVAGTVSITASGYVGAIAYETRDYTISGNSADLSAAAIQYSVNNKDWTSGTLTVTGDKTLYVRSTYAGPIIKKALLNVASADGSIVRTLAVTVSKDPDFVLSGYYGYTESENEDQDGRPYVDGNTETFHLIARKGGSVVASMPSFSFVFRDSTEGPWTQYTSTNSGTETPLLHKLAEKPSIRVTVAGTEYLVKWKDIVYVDGTDRYINTDLSAVDLVAGQDVAAVKVSALSTETWTVGPQSVLSEAGLEYRFGTSSTWLSSPTQVKGPSLLYLRSSYAGAVPKTVGLTLASTDQAVKKDLSITVSKKVTYTVKACYGYSESYNEDQDGYEYVEGNTETLYLVVTDGSTTWSKPSFSLVFRDSTAKGPWTTRTSCNYGTETPVAYDLSQALKFKFNVGGTDYTVNKSDVTIIYL
ncbi:MAG: DUF4906 domain-containing protein [Bacteroidales bacterium]|nr:DUF4906 domain-containing protein [Bacteroidales bacterium]